MSQSDILDIPTRTSSIKVHDAEGFAGVTFEVADAEALPYPAARFDVVLSTFGVMFAPDHEQSAREMMRVCAPGGRFQPSEDRASMAALKIAEAAMRDRVSISATILAVAADV